MPAVALHAHDLGEMFWARKNTQCMRLVSSHSAVCKADLWTDHSRPSTPDNWALSSLCLKRELLHATITACVMQKAQ